MQILLNYPYTSHPFYVGSFNVLYNSWKMQQIKNTVAKTLNARVGNKIHGNVASGSAEGREFHI
jgi:hypothetical protein